MPSRAFCLHLARPGPVPRTRRPSSMMSDCRGVIATPPVCESTRSGVTARARAVTRVLSLLSVTQRTAFFGESSSGSQVICAPKNYPALSSFARGGLMQTASRPARIARAAPRMARRGRRRRCRRRATRARGPPGCAASRRYRPCGSPRVWSVRGRGVTTGRAGRSSRVRARRRPSPLARRTTRQRPRVNTAPSTRV